MATIKSEDFPHPICERIYQLIDKKRGDRGLNAFMRDCGLNKSRYHNLKRSVPTTDSFLNIVQKINATQRETMEILGLIDKQPENRDKANKEDSLSAIMKTLLEVREDIRIIKESDLSALFSRRKNWKFQEMIAECIAGQTSEDLKREIETLKLKKINWEIFQEIAVGNRQPKTITEIREVKAIVDSENTGKYSLYEWYCSLL